MNEQDLSEQRKDVEEMKIGITDCFNELRDNVVTVIATVATAAQMYEKALRRIRDTNHASTELGLTECRQIANEALKNVESLVP